MVKKTNTIDKINETRNWFFGKISKIDNALTKLVSIRNDR